MYEGHATQLFFLQGFLKHDPKGAHFAASRDTQFRQAMEAVAGCRGPATTESGGHSQLSDVRRVLTPMFQVLPKNDHGRVEWKMAPSEVMTTQVSLVRLCGPQHILYYI